MNEGPQVPYDSTIHREQVQEELTEVWGEEFAALVIEFLDDNEDAGEVTPALGDVNWIADAMFWLQERT